MSTPPDGALSGEEPEGVELDDQQVGRLRQMMEAQMNPPAQCWRPACVNCVNNHKIAIGELVKKLNGMGLQVGDPQFAQAVQAAQHAGALMAQNPMMAMGQNGQRPDMIPPVRPADMIVNGSSCCVICFQSQKQTGLLIAPGGWTPGKI